MFIAATIMLTAVAVAVFQIFRNYRYKPLTDYRRRISPVVMSAVAVLAVLDMMCGPSPGSYGLVYVSLGLMPMLLLNSSLWEWRSVRIPLVISGVLMLSWAVYQVLCLCGVCKGLSSCGIQLVAVAAGFSDIFLFVSGIVLRIRNVKAVMKSGTVWSCICLCVEAVYEFFALMIPVGIFCISVTTGAWKGLHVWIGTLMLGAELAALGLRTACDSIFVLCHRHERTIVESLKISHVEAVSDAVSENIQYKDIYERVVAYFESDKPYLNGNLTINDIVKVVYSNKLYISRAISQYTGRNFCQFVNYHRISYSIHCFRENPELKIVELASACGFNSVVSFNMAFRLFIGENPSEWCRKERNRILKERKSGRF